ncbi:hypothetical protein ABGB17_20260 [Sphaerisporangium sp. B11E5]|uniref:hypothetical protein n=1 Tax=Sphaerisporangium sp. B11E5 TaxID=3153563 RepID=UPI00325ED576
MSDPLLLTAGQAAELVDKIREVLREELAAMELRQRAEFAELLRLQRAEFAELHREVRDAIGATR